MDGGWGYGLTWFLMVYSMFTNFVLLNIIASVIVDVIMSLSQEAHDKQEAKHREAELEDISKGVEQFFGTFSPGNGQQTWSLGVTELLDKKAAKVFEHTGMPPSDATSLLRMLDKDGTGNIDRHEMTEVLLRLKRPPDPKDILRIECNVGALNNKVDALTQTLSEVAASLERLEGKGGAAEPEGSAHEARQQQERLLT